MIILKNIDFFWQDNRVIDIKNLHIKEGEHLFLQGSSGSGKSTLLNLMAGVLTSNSGEVSVLGTSLNSLSPSKRDSFRANHIGFIFQQFNLIPFLSVLENVLLSSRFSPLRAKKALHRSSSLESEALRLLESLGLSDKKLLSRSVNELSVGQQQRVAAARAMFGSPEIIIADEPTSALDYDHREAFIKILFSECEKEGITLVFVSHDISLKKHFNQILNMSEINSVNL